MDLIENALAIALKAYAGKRDKAGKTYILHPLRVMAGMTDATDMAVALLHDVIEDSDISADDLRAAGIPETVVTAVVCLTKQEGETYDAFVDRVMQNPVARRVKIADIEDNINVLRLHQVTDKDLARVAKYHAAWLRLTR